eukprot:109150_1
MATDAKEKEEDVPTDELLLDFELNKKDVQQTKDIYCAQCNGLKNREHQTSLWNLLTIARKNRLPLLPLLIDSFTRDSLKYFLKHNETLQLNQWVEKYPTVKALSKDKTHHQMVQAAIATFCHRYSSLMHLPFIELYDDSIEEFTQYIIECTTLINKILDSDGTSCPFQIDMMIIPHQVVEVNSDNDEDDEDDEFDDDEFDDDSDDSDEEDSDEKKSTSDASQIGDIKSTLDENKILYAHTVGNRPRAFAHLFADLKQKCGKQQELPHAQRLCVVVDRRKGSSANSLFMYKPDLLGDLPSDHQAEWFFESSLGCVIPGKYQSDRITAKTAANGYVFCLSFHVEQRDRIKCYLYTRSQMIRFQPDDVHNLLPHLFTKREDNTKFISKEKANRECTQSIKLIDTQFDKFRAQTSK